MYIKDAPICWPMFTLLTPAIVSQLGITLSLNWLPKSPSCLAIFLLCFFFVFVLWALFGNFPFGFLGCFYISRAYHFYEDQSISQTGDVGNGEKSHNRGYCNFVVIICGQRNPPDFLFFFMFFYLRLVFFFFFFDFSLDWQYIFYF